MIDANYRQFSIALLPIFRGLMDYAEELQQVLLHLEPELMNLTPFITRLSGWYEKDYPEWVLKRGFNRHLRGGFRYVLFHLDETLEAFISFDYHLRQLGDTGLLEDVSKSLMEVLANNNKMMAVIVAFFNAEPIDQSRDDFTSDVTELYNIARGVLPASLELLDVSPDYLHIAALIRDAVDIRQILLKILTALPIDDLAEKE